MEYKYKERIRFNGLLHWKGISNKNDITSIFYKSEEILKEQGIILKGPFISSTNYELTSVTNDMLYFEFYIPISNRFESIDEYEYIDELILQNCLICRYKGNPFNTISSHSEIMEYINKNKIEKKEKSYSVFWGYDKDSSEMIVDIIYEMIKE